MMCRHVNALWRCLQRGLHGTKSWGHVWRKLVQPCSFGVRECAGILALLSAVVFGDIWLVPTCYATETADVLGRKDMRLFDGPSMFRAGRKTGLCALTFDDGPSRLTPRLLDILREKKVPATFFVLGTQVSRHPATIHRMVAEGHEIGSHTWSHKALRNLSPEIQEQELVSVNTILRELGVTVRFLRPPFGRYDANTLRIAAQLNMEVALWSVDSQDWQRPVRLEGLKSVMGGTKPALNGVMLFHDTHALTIEAIPELIDRLRENQCRFVTLSEFLEQAMQAYGVDDLGKKTLPSSSTQGATTPHAEESFSIAPESATRLVPVTSAEELRLFLQLSAATVEDSEDLTETEALP